MLLRVGIQWNDLDAWKIQRSVRPASFDVPAGAFRATFAFAGTLVVHLAPRAALWITRPPTIVRIDGSLAGVRSVPRLDVRTWRAEALGCTRAPRSVHAHGTIRLARRASHRIAGCCST